MQENFPPRPDVQYTRTADGVSIAYIEAGAGWPVLLLPFHHSHVERKWTAGVRGWTRGLAEANHMVTYDSRGQGLSTRNLAATPSLDDYRSDMEAVVKAAGLEHSVVVAYGGFAHVALSYAVEYPERVDALVLICTCESFSAWPLAGITALAQENWDLFADLLFGKTPEEYRESVIAFFKASTTSSDYVHLVQAFSKSSVEHLLDRLQMPVLILHSLDQHWLSVEEGARFATKVKGARLAYLDGDVEPNDTEGVRVIQGFLTDLGLNSPPSSTEDMDALRGTLTNRQLEVLALLASGRTNREIAGELVLSERTVERHLADVYAKLGARNRAEAVAFALRQA